MKKKKTEIRSFTLDSIKIETREEDEKLYLSGIIPFDSMSENMGGFREVIRSGAFTKTLQERDIPCLWNHDTRYVCGRNKNGTLTAEERAVGLAFECQLPDTSWARDLYQSVARRDVPGISFGFVPVKERWTYDEARKFDMRELLEVRLLEISVGVTFPAYPAAETTASKREFEEGEMDYSVINKIKQLRESKNDYVISDADAEELRSIACEIESLLGEKRSRAENETEPDEESTRECRERELALLELESANWME